MALLGLVVGVRPETDRTRKEGSDNTRITSRDKPNNIDS